MLKYRTPEIQKVLHIRSIGSGISSYVNIFNPEVIVLAGFLTSLFNYDPDRLLAAVKQGSLNASSERVLIRAGELGADLLMIGSAELAFKPLLENPGAAALFSVRKTR